MALLNDLIKFTSLSLTQGYLNHALNNMAQKLKKAQGNVRHRNNANINNNNYYY